MKLRILFLSSLLFVSVGSFCQVTGKITDVTNGYPLEYATAAIYNEESLESL